MVFVKKEETMRTLVLFTILCAFVAAWAAEGDTAQKKPLSLYEFTLESAHSIITPKWMNELRLADRSLYRYDGYEKVLLDRIENAVEITSDPRQMDLKQNMLGCIANTGYLGDLPPDSVYRPAHEEESGESSDTLTTRDEARRDMMRQSGLGSIANTGQLGDAPSDSVYQGSSSGTGANATTDARQQAFEDAKKENARNVMMGQVTNGGYNDNPDNGQYETNIQPAKKNIQVGEDRIPYLIKQLSSPQNPNKNTGDIQNDIRRQTMRDQVAQPNPYDDL